VANSATTYLISTRLAANPLTIFMFARRVSPQAKPTAMPMANRHTRITIETERTLMIARQKVTRGWCQQCGKEVDLLTPNQVELLFDAGSKQFKGEEQSKLHLEKAKDGLAVCMRSLLKLFRVGDS
jgi:hypothetical protein